MRESGEEEGGSERVTAGFISAFGPSRASTFVLVKQVESLRKEHTLVA